MTLVGGEQGANVVRCRKYWRPIANKMGGGVCVCTDDISGLKCACEEEFGLINKTMTATQWLSTPKYIHIIVCDPDGWRKPGMSWEDEITEEEFNKRVMESTCIVRNPKEPDVSPVLEAKTALLEMYLNEDRHTCAEHLNALEKFIRAIVEEKRW